MIVDISDTLVYAHTHQGLSLGERRWLTTIFLLHLTLIQGTMMTTIYSPDLTLEAAETIHLPGWVMMSGTIRLHL
jgi:hypothetical protein